jgi:SAM-dependent MidA family methyltransferase
MTEALYGAGGFFVRPDGGPAAHFRTTANHSPLLGRALAVLLDSIDRALGRPDQLDLVDIGAGRGELLTALLDAVPAELGARLRVTAVELAPRPVGLDPRIDWVDTAPTRVTGLLLATEWLDNVPLDVVEVDDAGQPRYVLVDRDGTETLGAAVSGPDLAWLDRWWPLDGMPPGTRAEVGAPRDAAWRAAVAAIDRGAALTIDYGHQLAGGQLAGDRPTGRPLFGTLTGFRAGRQVAPVPDGSCDLTAHVAIDAVGEAGRPAEGVPPLLLTQRAALHGLGVTGDRPPLALASTDPAGYVRALAAAGAAAELTDPAGLGGHWWLLQVVRCDLESYQRYADRHDREGDPVLLRPDDR